MIVLLIYFSCRASKKKLINAVLRISSSDLSSPVIFKNIFKITLLQPLNRLQTTAESQGGFNEFKE